MKQKIEITGLVIAVLVLTLSVVGAYHSVDYSLTANGDSIEVSEDWHVGYGDYQSEARAYFGNISITHGIDNIDGFGIRTMVDFQATEEDTLSNIIFAERAQTRGRDIESSHDVSFEFVTYAEKLKVNSDSLFNSSALLHFADIEGIGSVRTHFDAREPNGQASSTVEVRDGLFDLSSAYAFMLDPPVRKAAPKVIDYEDDWWYLLP